MSRTRIGVVALLLAAIGAGMWLFAPPGAQVAQATAACLRVGTVLAALWLALPSLQVAANRAVLGALLGLAVVLALWPKLFLLALGLLLLAAFLRPRLQGSPRPNAAQPGKSR